MKDLADILRAEGISEKRIAEILQQQTPKLTDEPMEPANYGASKEPANQRQSDEMRDEGNEEGNPRVTEIPLKQEEKIEDDEPSDNDDSDEALDEEIAEEINSLSGELARARARLRPWMLQFVDELARFGVVVDACRAASVSDDSVRAWKQKNADFAMCYDLAIKLAMGRIERRGMRIAAEGTRRAIYHQGKIVGFEREYDTGMIQFMLKKRMPEQYADKQSIEITGTVAHLHVPMEALADRAKDLLPWLAEKRAKVLGVPKTIESGDSQSQP